MLNPPTKTIETDRHLDIHIDVKLASKMADKLSFQSNIEFTDCSDPYFLTGAMRDEMKKNMTALI